MRIIDWSSDVCSSDLLEDIPSSYWDEFLNRITERYNLDLTNGRGSRYEIFCESLFSGDPATTKRQIGRLVGYMISNTMIQTRDYDHPLFYYEATMRTKALDLLTQLKRFIHARVITYPQLQQTRFKIGRASLREGVCL